MKAVFLDRDGVLIQDTNLLVGVDEVAFIPGTLEALRKLKELGFLLFVVTNQTVVSRGLATEGQVQAVHEYINRELEMLIDRFYYCPHHPEATLAEYRTECGCRKPGSGMLEQGAREFGVDLQRSWMVGDRISDIVAGRNAGCRTVQVLSGEHGAKPIVSNAMPAELPEPDFTAESLYAACSIIEENMNI